MKRYFEYTTIEPKYKFERKGLLDSKTGIQYEEVVCNENFIDIGIVPSPKNKIQHLKHDLLHGLLMNYSLLSVIEYSLRYYFNYWNGWGDGKR